MKEDLLSKGSHCHSNVSVSAAYSWWHSSSWRWYATCNRNRIERNHITCTYIKCNKCSINNLQNSAIRLSVKMGKIRNIHFVRNLTLNIYKIILMMSSLLWRYLFTEQSICVLFSTPGARFSKHLKMIYISEFTIWCEIWTVLDKISDFIKMLALS